MQKMQKILCWSLTVRHRELIRYIKTKLSICIRDAYSLQPGQIWQPRTYFTTTTTMSKRKTYELLGIFLYTDTAETTFIDGRSENQRLKPPVLSG